MATTCIDLCASDDEVEDAPGPSATYRISPSDSDVELVEDPEPPAAAAAPAAQEELADLGEDEDLVVTRAVGDVATVDYPHSRCDCGQKAFQKGQNVESNAEHCDNCYCFVCDTKVADCTSWGTGTSGRDHCNAYACPSWQSLRNARRRGATAPAAAARLATGPRGSGSGRSSMYGMYQHLIDAFRSGAAPGQPAARQAAASAPRRDTLPNPADSPGAFELGTIELAIEAVEPHTVSELKAKLNPHGFYMDPMDPLDQGIPEDQLSLSNMFQFTYNNEHKRVPKYCSLKPIVDEEVLQHETAVFLRKVTVVHHAGQHLPTAYGVAVTRRPTVAEIVAAVEKLLPTPLSDNEELKVVQLHNESCSMFPPWEAHVYGSSDEVVRNYMAAVCKGLWVYRVPKAPANAVWAVVTHRLLPEALAAAGVGDENIGTPHLVSLSAADASGGSHAATTVVKGASAYMKCYPHQAAVHSLAGMVKVYRYGSYHHAWQGKPPHRTNFSKQSDTPFSGGTLRLVAGWRRTPSVPLPEFSQVVQHESASEELLKESTHRLEEAKMFETQRHMDDDLPYMCIEELKSYTRRAKPTINKSGRQVYSIQPTLACELSIEAVNGSEKDGKVKFKIFTWRRAQEGNLTMLQDFDSSYAHTQLGGMSHVMHLLARQSSAVGRQMVLSFARQQWMGKHNRQSVKGLLDSLQEVPRKLAEQPEGLAVSLHHHQLESLHHMQAMEDADGGYRARFWLPIQTSASAYWYSPLFDRACPAVPSQPSGGFLAEPMGLGKTVITLGLMASRPPPPAVVAGVQTGTGDSTRFVSRATLVVCAVSLAGQWLMEASSKMAQAPRALMFHGSKARIEPRKLAANFDLVVTTYGMVREDSPLLKVQWYRVIFDEAHSLKEAKTKQSQNCSRLLCQRRWLLSGTPINGGIGDLYGQFVAMQFAPLDRKSVFDTLFRSSHAYLPQDLTKAFSILSCLMIRHTKQHVTQGKHAIKLPPKTQNDVPVVLTETELAAYNSVHKKAKPAWLQHQSAGARHISTHLFTIMALLQPLRRICAGGHLTAADLEVNTTFVADHHAAAAAAIPADDTLVVPQDAECSICLDTIEAPCMTPCRHWFCQECITSCLTNSGKCPLCRTDVVVASLRAGVVPSAAEPGAGEEAMADITVCNSKLRVLLHELAAMQQQQPGAKALVFTQYRSNVAWLREALCSHGYDVHFITGDMTARKREKTIEAFNTSRLTSVFLLSMRTGAVGINLTAANHVFIMEPFLNPALEEQAVGRAWRMGQVNEVHVKRFYLQGSVEERIINVAKKKQAAQVSQAEAAQQHTAGLGEDGDEEDGAAATGAMVPGYMAPFMSRKAARAQAKMQGVGLAGNLTADKQALRAEELALLFQEPNFPPPLPADTSVSPLRDPAEPGPSGAAYATRSRADASTTGTAGVKRQPEEQAEEADSDARQVRQRTEDGAGGSGQAAAGTSSAAAPSGSGGSAEGSQPKGWMAYLAQLKRGTQE